MKKLVGTFLVVLSFALPMLSLVAATSANAAASTINFNNPAFQTIWQRNDLPVLQNPTTVGRSWTWGLPIAAAPTSETYNGTSRTVQYFDKGRMEVNDPTANPNNLFFVTSGLLVKELVTGMQQNGDNSFTPFANGSATIPVAGDPANPSNQAANNNAPTYASFKSAPSATSLTDGTVINSSISKDGTISTITPTTQVKVVASAYDKATQHNMVDVFVNYQNQTGLTYANGQLNNNPIFYGNPLFVFGHPISEPYWVTTNLAGKPTQVLVQLFERRVLTYTPSNPTGSQVEMGNVGQHYYQWRYNTPSPIQTVNGYTVSLFASGTPTLFNPDSIVADSGHVYIDYQNKTAKDGTDTNTSTIVDYSNDGQMLHTYSVVGHSDGMRLNPYTHLLWITCNEDGNPRFYTLNPQTGELKQYTVPAVPHGGGLDDVQFVNGLAFVADSNPNLNSAGVNVFPAVDKVDLQGSNVVLTPILMGNASALDTTTNSTVTLNEIDPDSMMVDPQGDLVLDNQGGAEMVFIKNPGTANQVVTRVPLGTQVDDSAWATSTSGRLFVVDAKQNATYVIRTNFSAGQAYTEAPSDSGVAGFVGTLDLTTGTITPIAVGFGSPTGLIYVPD